MPLSEFHAPAGVCVGIESEQREDAKAARDELLMPASAAKAVEIMSSPQQILVLFWLKSMACMRISLQ
jgi:hypothetical protein